MGVLLSPRVRVLWLWMPVLLYMAAIFGVSGMSDPGLPGGVSDKLAHAAAYMGLGILSVRAVAGGLPAPVTLRVALLGMLIACGHGAFDEVHQMFVPGRSADVADWYADVAGAWLGLGACWAWGMIVARADE